MIMTRQDADALAADIAAELTAGGAVSGSDFSLSFGSGCLTLRLLLKEGPGADAVLGYLARSGYEPDEAGAAEVSFPFRSETPDQLFEYAGEEEGGEV